MATPNTKRDNSRTDADLYNTPSEALIALTEAVGFSKNKTYFEPCNGLGKISSHFKKELDIDFETNEMYDYGVSTTFKEDFLNPSEGIDWNYDIIVSNPPYKSALEFVQRGFEVATEQYLFLRLSFLEGKKRKQELFSQKHLRKVYIMSYRVSCSKGIDEEPQANSVCYAWFHFDRQFTGNPKIIWL